LEACSIYLVNKMLINEDYAISVTSKKMLEDFGETFKNVLESITLLPLPMKSVLYIFCYLRSIVADLTEQIKLNMNYLK
jgi:hypothetical protein